MESAKSKYRSDVNLAISHNIQSDTAALSRTVNPVGFTIGDETSESNLSDRHAPLLDAAQLHRLLIEWNDTVKHYPLDQGAHQLFQAQAARTPCSVAVTFDGTALTYAELNLKANRLAHYLRSIGVGPDVLVGICVQRSLDMIIGLLAILKAGGAYVPLDPAYPKDRLAYMLADANMAVLLTQHHLLESLPEIAVPTFCLDTQLEVLANHADIDPANITHPGNLAYVIYTSGSTGKPKGVGVTHSGLANFLHAMQQAPGITQDDALLSVTSLSFDIAALELFLPLSIGAKLVLVTRDTAANPGQLVEMIERLDISMMQATPSTWRMLADYAWPNQKRPMKILCGGEMLPINLARKLLQNVPVIWNLYGPTETTIWSSAYCITSDENPLSIGRPIANTQIYLLDPDLNPVPTGDSGELHIAGDGLARGYLHRPDLTAEKFIPNPFSSVPGARMYKSGDLARYLPDGNIDYIGRIDHQVKIRGFRIELGEIETALASLQGIRDAIAIAREDVPGDKRLVAYIVAKDETARPDGESLRSALSATLPDYMVPAHFVLLDQFPLTPNGKIDRKALPAPDIIRSAAGYVAPRTSTENILAAIWADVLSIDKVGVTDNFFVLGGHSLLAVTLIERMRQVGLHTDIRTLFTTPTVAALASAVSTHGIDVDVPPNGIHEGCRIITPDMLTLVQLSSEEITQITHAAPGGAANIQDIYPLAPLQEGILFHHLMTKEGDPYLLQMLIGFDTRVRLDGFLNALQIVIDRHDILRTAILWDGLPQPVQVVLRQATMVVEEVSVDQNADVAHQLRTRYNPRRYKLDVSKAPLLRSFIAYDATNGRWMLQLLQHHLANDQTALEILFSEIQAILKGQQKQLPEALPFRNFIAQTRLGVSQAEHETFFTQMLADVDEPTAPFGLLDVQGDGSGIEEARLELDATLSTSIRQHVRNLGVSAASLMHLAWAQVLARATGRKNVVFGTILFGRMHGGIGADRVMGPFINTLPVCIRIDETNVVQRVQDTHALLTQMLRHEHASLALAQRCSGVAATAPLFSALFNYRHGLATQFGTTAAWDGIEILEFEERTNYPCTLSVDDMGDDFALTAQVLGMGQAQRVCDYMYTALAQLIAALETGPNSAVNSTDVLPVKERRQLLVDWNDTAARYSQDQALHQLFEAQVMRTPGNAAIVFEENALTYAQLNLQANRLAHRLRNLGVGPDIPVGVYLDRSLDMIVGLFAILKAGGAYMPLDPAYPKERIAYMLADAKPSVILTLQSLCDALPTNEAMIFCMDAQADSLAAYPAANPTNTTNPGNLAYLIYTSGSTGQPKGVSGSVGALVNRLEWMQTTFPCKEGDAHIQKTSLNFVDSITETLGPLLYGGQLHIAPANVVGDLHQLWQFIEQKHIVRIVLVPSLLNAMLQSGGQAVSQQLNCIICSGEKLPASLLRSTLDAFTSTTVLNLYGSSEVTGDVTFHVCVPNANADTPVPLGRPIANTQIYLLDAHLSPVPLGVAGELYLGGANLTRGYYNRPDLTADKFIPNPFSAVPGARMFKSGDLARYQADGNIEYLGRADHQVKIRGFRIELGEIESALAAVPGIRDVVVLAREDIPDEKLLAAYLVCDDSVTADIATTDATQLRAALAKTLPDYMIPGHFTVLDKLPLNPNGKVERKALPAPDRNRKKAGYIGPRNQAEEILAGIWSEVLKIDKIGVQDNFFSLGGHSLQTMAVISKLKKSGFSLTTQQFFVASTVEELAKVMTKLDEVQTSAAAQESITGKAPLLPSNYWFFQRRDLNHYNVSFLLEVLGKYSQESLKNAVSALQAHHDVLRSVLVQDGQRWWQIFQSPEELTPWWEAVDLADTPDDDIAQEIRKVAVPAQRSLDITRIRFRAIYFDLGKTRRARLLFIFHHEIVDRYSLEIFKEDLIALTERYAQGLSPSLPKKTTSVKELAQAYERYAQGTLSNDNDSIAAENILVNISIQATKPYPTWDSQAIYWGGDTVRHDGANYRAQWWTQGDDPSTHHDNGHPWTISTIPLSLAMAEELAYWHAQPWEKYRPLPTDSHPELLLPDTGVSEPVFLRESLSEQESQQLEALPRLTGFSMEDILLTALVLAYGEWAGSRALCVALLNNGRSALPEASLDLSRTIGYLVNCLIRFVYIEDNVSLRDAATSIQAQRNATRGKEADYSLLRFASADPHIRREMDCRPGPQLEQNFYPREADDSDNYGNGFRVATESIGAEEAPLGSQFRPFSKTYFSPEDGHFTVQWAYCPCMYTETTARALLNANISALRSLIRCLYPEQKMNDHLSEDPQELAMTKH